MPVHATGVAGNMTRHHMPMLDRAVWREIDMLTRNRNILSPSTNAINYSASNILKRSSLGAGLP